MGPPKCSISIYSQLRQECDWRRLQIRDCCQYHCVEINPVRTHRTDDLGSVDRTPKRYPHRGSVCSNCFDMPQFLRISRSRQKFSRVLFHGRHVMGIEKFATKSRKTNQSTSWSSEGSKNVPDCVFLRLWKSYKAHAHHFHTPKSLVSLTQCIIVYSAEGGRGDHLGRSPSATNRSHLSASVSPGSKGGKMWLVLKSIRDARFSFQVERALIADVLNMFCGPRTDEVFHL